MSSKEVGDEMMVNRTKSYLKKKKTESAWNLKYYMPSIDKCLGGKSGHNQIPSIKEHKIMLMVLTLKEWLNKEECDKNWKC